MTTVSQDHQTQVAEQILNGGYSLDEAVTLTERSRDKEIKELINELDGSELEMALELIAKNLLEADDQRDTNDYGKAAKFLQAAAKEIKNRSGN